MTTAQNATETAAKPTPFDAEARNARVMENQGLVHQVARGFRGRGVALEDLVQFGNLGLIQAGDKFEPERGLKFSTYAVYWIRQAIFKGIAATGRPIRVPANARKEARAVFAREKELEAAGWARPTLPQVVDSMEARGDHKPARSERLLRAAEADGARFGVKPLEELPHADGAPSVLSTCIDSEHREQMAWAAELLPDDQRELLTLRYGLGGSPPLAPSTAAALLGIGWRKVDRLKREAIAELKRLRGLPVAGGQEMSLRAVRGQNL